MVKNNDTIENILTKFSVKKEEIAFVVKEIKKQKFIKYNSWSKNKVYFKKI